MEAIRNANLPAIQIYWADPGAEALAAAIGYGIEEEGLPFEIIESRLLREEACELTKQPGLGVVILFAEGRAAVYTRQMKTPGPLFDVAVTDRYLAAVIGKNAARIIKNKPFLETE